MGAKKHEDDFIIPMYFDPKRVGEALYEVSNDVLQTKKHEVASKWYTGYDDTDFFTWQDLSGNFIKAQLTYCGQVFEWNLVTGVKTGVLIEEESPEKGIKASEIIQYDTQVAGHTKQNAVDLIRHLINMPEEDRLKLIENIESNRTIDSMSQEEFWLKYGHSDVKYSKSKFLLGWRILVHQIRQFFKR